MGWAGLEKKYGLLNAMFKLGIKFNQKTQGIHVWRLKSDYFCLLKSMHVAMSFLKKVLSFSCYLSLAKVFKFII